MGYIVQRCLAARWSILTSAFTRSVENTNWHLAECRATREDVEGSAKACAEIIM